MVDYTNENNLFFNINPNKKNPFKPTKKEFHNVG